MFKVAANVFQSKLSAGKVSLLLRHLFLQYSATQQEVVHYIYWLFSVGTFIIYRLFSFFIVSLYIVYSCLLSKVRLKRDLAFPKMFMVIVSRNEIIVK